MVVGVATNLFSRNCKKNRVRHKHADDSKYCWSHEKCAYTLCDCTIKIQGHKYAAVFANKMIVLTYYYQAATVTPDPASVWWGGIDKEPNKLNEIGIKVKSKREYIYKLFIVNATP